MLCRSVGRQVLSTFSQSCKYMESVRPRFRAAQSFEKPVRYINEQMQYINFIQRDSHLPNDWLAVKSQILSKRGDMNSKNINAVVLKSFLSSNNYNHALSFVDYLKSSEEDFSLGTINGILKLYFFMGKQKKLSEEDTAFIRDTHRTLKSKYGVLDSVTCESLVHALSVVGDWKECLHLFQDIKISSCPSHSAYSSVISTLFRCDEKKEAIDLIRESMQDNRPLIDYVYDDWIDYIVRNNKDPEGILKELEELHMYLSDNFVRVGKSVADKILDTYVSKLGWSGSHTEISANGKCHSCKKTLDCIQITQEEFALLQSSFKERVLVGKDVFLKTNPEELERFVTFIDQTAPYDIVLDALNIAYAIGKSSPVEKLKFLKAVIVYFLERNKKILLLGRDHIRKWPKQELNFILKNTNNFFTNDLSQDDPFLLTASIFSGPKTDFLSRDKMRGHRFLLGDDRLRSIFLRWQWQHQWTYYVKGRNLPVVMPPLKFTPCAQRGAGWHAPYERASATAHEDPMNAASPIPANWLCLQPPVHQ